MAAWNDSSSARAPRSPDIAPTTGPFDASQATVTKTPVLEACNIKRSFRIGDRDLGVLFGVDMKLEHGERLGLVGSSGAGKSTFLHTLGLLDRPSSGEVLIEGVDAWALSGVQRAQVRNHRIGFVFQMYHLLPELSALENVILPGMIEPAGFLGMGGRKRRRMLMEKGSELLTSFGLGDRLKHRPSQLSGGERQRVSIARALILDPPLLIADEPTGNLDSATGQKILNIIFAEQERRDLSLLLVTHDEKVAERCDRVLHMVDGLIQTDAAEPEPAPDEQ